MLDECTIESFARAYHVAEKERRRTRAPSVLHPALTAEDAHAIQRKWISIKVAEGNVVKCHNIGLTSRAMQRLTVIARSVATAIARRVATKQSPS
jgi:2-oxo-hept-3-ene-1,7-dioate hydratase